MRSSTVLASFFTLLVLLIGFQWLYLSQNRALTPQNKAEKVHFTALVGLPDLALVSEAHYVRHRSLSDVFSFFGDSPELLEYFPSTFIYHFSSVTHHPSRIMREE